MWWTIGKTVVKCYGLLWMTAIGGFLGANLSATIGILFFVSENKGVYVQPWAHSGWCIGTVLFFVGAIIGKLRFINSTVLGSKPEQSNDESGAIAPNDRVAKAPPKTNEQSGAPGFVFACGLAGGFLGLLLAGSLIVFPMSYSYSPLATQKAVTSVEVVREQMPDSGILRNVFKTKHPMTMYLYLTPVVLGTIGGAMGGGLIVVKYRDRKVSSLVEEKKESPTP